jgi:bifunctional UDP-N-acetylglucosamine pyrophosphorylase/glucosamine-1-phosphate N-acetyltransferase
VRDEDGYVQKIVEHKDATPDILKINEINAGIYIFQSQPLFAAIPKLKNENSQGEYYLPDVKKMYVEQDQKVAAVLARQSEETHGINDADQLRRAEKILKRRSMPI